MALFFIFAAFFFFNLSFFSFGFVAVSKNKAL